MLVRASENRYGHILLVPVSASISAKMRRDCIKNGAPADFDPEVYLQQDGDIEQFKQDYPDVWKQIDGGYSYRFRMDNWTYRHMVGYCAE